MGRRLTRALLLLGALSAGESAELLGQACESGRITSIFINGNPVFDTSGLDDGASFVWFYDFANSLHMQTDDDFVEGELLFEVGDCYDPLLASESERLLRQLDFIARADVFPVPQPDGSIHVVVDTQDEWTLQFSLRTRFDDGFEFNGVNITEENLLGKGIVAGAFYRTRREERDVGGGLRTARFFGTRWDAQLEAGKTRVGDFFQQSFVYPFVGEVGRYGAIQRYERREELFAYSLPEGGPFTHTVLPIRVERAEFTVAGRLGHAGRLTVLGLGISRDELDFTSVDNGAEVVRNDDFSRPEPAPADIAEEVAPLTRETSSTRLNVILGQRNLRFERRSGLDAMRGVQDVPVGGEVTLTLGRTLGFLGANSQREDDDFFARVRLFGALAPGRWVFASAVSLESRRIFDDPEENGWNDVIGELDLYTYWQPTLLPRHTFFGRLSGAGGWSMTVPFQLTLGGESALRGYDLDRLPGGRRLIATLEDRIYLGSPGSGRLDLGATVFADIGSVWHGDVPFGIDSGFRASVGAGLRVGFPGGTRQVMRLDIAFPVNGPDAFSGPIFRITASELLGLITGFEDGQLARGRRSRVGASLLPDPSTGR